MRIFYIGLLCAIATMSVFSQDLKQKVASLSELPKEGKIVFVDYDPFKRGEEVVLKTIEKKKQDNRLHVTSIMNQRVFIDSKWYSVGDEVRGYKILQINALNILAKNDDKVVKLGMEKSNKLLKIRNKKQ
jgi:hypothetical protein